MRTSGNRTPEPEATFNPEVFYPSGFAKEVGFNFEIEPPIVKSGEDFVADVVIVDQFRGEHTVTVTFEPNGAHVWPD